MYPIVRNIKTNDLYSWDGTMFTNLRTGISGVVRDDVARKTFRINLEATEMLNKHPHLKEMIRTLNLKFDPCQITK